jgi:hypothetical protein
MRLARGICFLAGASTVMAQDRNATEQVLQESTG